MAILRSSIGVGTALFMILPAVSLGEMIKIRRDSVIPVVLEDNLSISDRHAGDVFTVRAADDSPLPKGSELLGKIDQIHPASGKRPSSMDIRFTRIMLPDNSSIKLDAAAIPLDDRYIIRGKDGRLVAKQNIRKQQGDVIGGAIGGFIIGSIFHRKVAGAIIGTVIGAAVAESDRQKDNNTIASTGDKLGALVNKDITVDVPDSDRVQQQKSEKDSDLQVDRRVEDRQDTDRIPRSDRHYKFDVRFKDRAVTFPSDAKPYWIGETLMVPLEPTADQLGLDVDRRKDRIVYVDGKDMNLKLTRSSRQAQLNGDHIVLPRTVAEHNGVLYVPLDALAMVIKENLTVNGTKYFGKS